MYLYTRVRVSTAMQIDGYSLEAQKTKMNEEMLDAAVAEVISKSVSNPKFSDLIRSKINMEVDTGTQEKEGAIMQAFKHFGII